MEIDFIIKRISKSWMLFLLLACLWFIIPVAHATATYKSECKAKGGPYANCYQPPSLSYDGADGTYFATEADAENYFINKFTTGSSYSFLCPHGCYFDKEPNDSAPQLTFSFIARQNPYGSSPGNDSVGSLLITVVADCYENDYHVTDLDASGSPIRWCARPLSPSPNSVNTTPSSKIFTKVGCAISCDPVNLYDRSMTDYKVDYQNHSPFPIVWSRIYTTNGAGKRWYFNYERSITVEENADQLHATINLQREDGQMLDVQGTRASLTDDWTWTPNPSNQVPAVPLASPMTAKIIASQDLSSIQILNNQDELESYNSDGLLSKLEDQKGNFLTFTYTNKLLTNITDNTGRYLDISYTTNGTQKTGSTGQVDSNGNPITDQYTQYASTTDIIKNEAPTSVTDGTNTIAYDYQMSTNGNNVLELTDVAQSDGTVVSYTYSTNNSAVWLTTLDENNNTYQTFTLSGDSVTSTALGNGLDHYLYGGGHITLPTGLQVNVGFNNNGQLTSMTRPCPTCDVMNRHAITYDAYGDPVSLTDFKGNVETRTYDTARSLPLTITKASGTALAQTTSYTWDSVFRLPDQIVKPVATPNGSGMKVTNFTYDTSGNVTAWNSTVTDSTGYTDSRSGSATYNAHGEVLTSTDAKGHVTSYGYDSLLNLTSVTNSLNQTTTLGGYDAVGNVGWIQDPNGLKTKFAYDAHQRLTQIKKGCDSGSACHWESVELAYTPFGAISKITAPNGMSVAYHYDTAHRVIQKDVLDATGTLLGSEYLTLDNGGSVTNDVYKDASGNVLQQHIYVMDDLDRVKQFVDNESKIFQSNNTDDNLLTSTVDPLNHTHSYQYDALKRLIQVTLPDSATETETYGSGNEVASQKDAKGLATTYHYDGFGDVLEKNSPDSGTSFYAYDLNGNLTQSTDGRGKVIDYTYDALDRETSETAESSGGTVVKTYDTCTNGMGKLCSVMDRTGTTSFTYDLWGRETSKTEVMDGHTFAIGYTYDNAGQLTDITYPSGKVIHQTWTNGQVTAQSVGAQTILSNVNVDAFGDLLGWQWASGRQVVFNHDLDGRISGITYGSTVYTVGKDDAWKTSSKTQTSPAYSMMYGYDSRDRLTSDSVWGSYAYDANSNRTSYLGSLGPLSYGYGTTNNQLNLFNGSAVTMDASGNILSRSGMAFTYDDWNRMRSATVGSTVTSYGVNGLGERVSKAQGIQKAYYIYAGVGQLLGVYDTLGNSIEEYVYLNNRPVASLRGTNDIYPVETDETMTPVRVLDSSNNVVWSWEGKEAFGLSAPTETMVNGSLFKFYLRFPGQYVDEETGLFQNGYRDYDSTTGRYMEVDPLGLMAGMNDYGYVDGNSVNNIDPSGLILNTLDQTPDHSGVSKFNLAISFLKNNSSHAREYIESLESSPIIYTVLINNYDQHKLQNATSYEGHASAWTDDFGIYAKSSNSCGQSSEIYYNPAITLIHELTHLTNQTPKTFDPSYNDAEERRVILGMEASVMHDIYGGTWHRDSHTLEAFENYYTSSPISSSPMNAYRIYPVIRYDTSIFLKKLHLVN